MDRQARYLRKGSGKKSCTGCINLKLMLHTILTKEKSMKRFGMKCDLASIK